MSGTTQKSGSSQPQESTSQKTTSTQVKSKLLCCAARSLSLRYGQVIEDMNYWDNIHSSHMLQKYDKQLTRVRDNIDKKIDFDRKQSWEVLDQEQKSNESISYARQLVEAFEAAVRQDWDPEKLPKFRAFYKARADHLSTNPADESSLQAAWWIYFRLALEERMVPKYNNFLDKVDIIARDCYFYLLRAIGIIEIGQDKKLRLEEQQAWLASPVTILRIGGVYGTLSSRYAPVPYIFVPFDRMNNVWNLCAIHHEVAHDFFHKLNSLKDRNESLTVAEHFRDRVQAKLKDLALEDPNLKTEVEAVSQFLSNRYLDWLEELFADMIGIMLAGPTYINSLLEILFDDNVGAFVSHEYPSTYMRVIINLIFAGGQLGYVSETLALLREWLTVFGDPQAGSNAGDLPEKSRQVLMKLWLNQKTSTQPTILDAFQTLFQAVDDLTRQLNVQKNELRRPQINLMAFAKKPNGDQQQLISLTPVGVMLWLLKFVEACWQAELVPGRADISLQKIYTHMEHPDNEFIKRTAQTLSGDEVKPMKRVECRPRYLVPATRLAFERLVLEPESELKIANLRKIFSDSLQEDADVTNVFEALAGAVEQRIGWDPVADYDATRQVSPSVPPSREGFRIYGRAVLP
ncbi:MAG: hypothetical protein AB1801_16895 [Chloroflexota bacterium]